MGLTDNAAGWGWITRVLHWAIAVLVLFLLGLGAYMTNVEMDVYAQFDLVQTHKSWGFVVFVLAVLRILWRLVNRRPAPEPGAPAWQEAWARVSHYALYLLTIAMPVSGWLNASASGLQELFGVQNRVFGQFTLWDPFVPGDERLATLFAAIHHYGAMALAALVALHVAAALKHHFWDRDAVLRRMLRGR